MLDLLDCSALNALLSILLPHIQCVYGSSVRHSVSCLPLLRLSVVLLLCPYSVSEMLWWLLGNAPLYPFDAMPVPPSLSAEQAVCLLHCLSAKLHFSGLRHCHLLWHPVPDEVVFPRL